MLLSLDTATRQAGLALYDGSGVRAQASWHSALHHTEWLAPTIDDALRRINASASDLTAVAVTVGPGSFTGLRVALSVAKGIAAARDLPLIGVSTLDVTAYPHVGAGVPLCATLQAGRGRHAYAFYSSQATRDALLPSGMTIATIKGIGAALEEYEEAGPVRVSGELSPAERQFLTEQLPGRVELLPPALAVRSPAVLAELAWQRLQAGQVDDLHELEPLYLHLPGGGGA